MTRLRRLAALACVHLLMPAALQAQITITSPASGQRLPAGLDFATEVLGDPWDMSNRDDYSLDPSETRGFAGDFTLDNGQLEGTITDNDAQVMLLHRGYGPAVNPGRSGMSAPISTAAYRLLAFKMSSTAAGQWPQLYWFFNPHDSGGDQVGFRFADASTAAGQNIFLVDLTKQSSGHAWTSQALVRGLRIDFNTVFTPNTRMGLDWVRLVPADGAAGAVTHDVTWIGSNSGTYTLFVEELGQNPARFRIATVDAAASGNHRYTWSYGFLPPGSYRLAIEHSSGKSQSVDFRINDAPTITLTNPDLAGGADFATTELGNAWDMSDAADVPFAANLSGSSFGGGEFHGTSANNDSQVWTLIDRTNPTDDPMIDPARYHRVTVRVLLDGPFDLGPAGGSMARFFWGSGSNRPDLLTGTGDIVLWPGWNTYTFDLSALPAGKLVPSPVAEPWTSGAKRHFRFDPHEGTDPRSFHVDFISLAADDAVAPGGTFGITWKATDADDSAAVALYYDTDTDPSGGLVHIAGNLSAAAGGFNWHTSGVPPGTYYIYAVVSDGLNQQGRYSTGPIVVAAGSVASPPAPPPPAPPAPPAPPSPPPSEGPSVPASQLTGVLDRQTGIVDLNGDGRGDIFSYNPATGEWRADLEGGTPDGALNAARTGAWSGGWTVKAADFNADGLTDFFLYSAATGQWFKAINNGALDFTYFTSRWSAGWTFGVLDLNGDGRSDIFLYDPATGAWFRCVSLGDGTGEFAYASGVWSAGWQVHMLRLDPDALTDLFLYSPVTGQWFTAINDGQREFRYATGFWSAGWTVRPADLDGDGRSDLFLYDPSTGLWFSVLNTGSGFVYRTESWSAGWAVHAADLNADALTDIFLYDRTTGGWFQCLSNGAGGFGYVAGTWEPGWSVRFADVTRDNRADALLYNAGTGAMVFQYNRGAGSFEPSTTTLGSGFDVIASH